MSKADPGRRPTALRAVAAALIRGPDAAAILDDLDELMARDLEQGMPRWRVVLRYAAHTMASAFSVWRARARIPRIPGVSWLDLKLGARMLIKYPGLTLVATLAMFWVISLAVLVTWFTDNLLNPTLPLEEGERVVAIRNLDARLGWPYQWSALDLVSWRDELESIEDLGAFRPFSRHLITEDGQASPVESVEISASAFRIARVPPLLGRPLIEQDEEAGATPVVVIGYELWQERFDSDPGVVGQTIRLGATPTVVVGVMPAGFKFPVREELWVPLRTGMLDYAQRDRPSVNLFGRLADGASIQTAQAELATVAARTTDGTLAEPARAVVAPYPEILRWGTGWTVPAVPWPQFLLLLVVAANVAILVFARSAGRTSEITMRLALGASRSRIVVQMFIEALALVSVAAVGVLLVGNWGLDRVESFWDSFVVPVPFWWTSNISGRTVLRVGILTLAAALITGVIPALKVTRSALASGVRRASTGGTGLRFGRLPTVVIFAQVAISVGLLTLALEQLKKDPVFRSVDEARPLRTGEYVATRLQLDGDPNVEGGGVHHPEFISRYTAILEELGRRVAAEPEVSGVTFTSTPPVGPPTLRRIEVEGVELPRGSGAGHLVRAAQVDSNFFDIMGGAVLSGTSFASPAADRDSVPGSVVVDDLFVSELLGGQNPVGRRLRHVSGTDDESGPWLEITGVVSDMALYPGDPELRPAVYEPVDPARYGLFLVAHVRGDADAFAPHLRTIGLGVDPSLRLEQLGTLEQGARESWMIPRVQRVGISLVGATALALCLAGIYALMSFIVAERRTEIGIRTALGAHPRRVITAIFGRALLQLGLGVFGGVILVTLGMGAGAVNARGSLTVVSVGMIAAGLLACALPTSRALRIEPTASLREM